MLHLKSLFLFLVFALYNDLAEAGCEVGNFISAQAPKLQKKFEERSARENIRFHLRPKIQYPIGEPQGVAIIVHGLGQSPAVMEDMTNYALAKGKIAVSILLPSHGTVDPIVLNRARYTEWLAEISDVLSIVLESHVKVSLIGYSVGGGLVSYIAAKNPTVTFDQIILIAPLFKFSDARLKQIEERTGKEYLEGDQSALTDVGYKTIAVHAYQEAQRFSDELLKNCCGGIRANNIKIVTASEDNIIDSEILTRPGFLPQGTATVPSEMSIHETIIYARKGRPSPARTALERLDAGKL